MTFELARQIADAILYEGYVLYPYRASSRKNQVRWQFGVLTPRAWSESGSDEPWASQTECLIEPRGEPVLRLKVRFLQAQARTVEAAGDREGTTFQAVPSLHVEGTEHIAWDEGVAREFDANVSLSALLEAEQAIPFAIPPGREEASIRSSAGELVGRVVRERWPLAGMLHVSAEQLPGPYGVVKFRARVENANPWAETSAGRDEALRHSLIAAHTLLALSDGAFISLVDHPEWAKFAVAGCTNRHTWPVLIGETSQRDLMLSSPIILGDYPRIAPESAGDLYDGTEIDEILTLRTLTLTDQEKREARGTDPRAAAIIDRVDTMPAEMIERLHGAVRTVQEAAGEPAALTEQTPWWDPGADASVSPDTDAVLIDGVAVARGSQVRLRPGQRRADAQDMFLVGRVANVEAVFLDVEDHPYLAVTVEGDPAADLHRMYGRFFYFSPDEVEPLEGRT